jgi:hypothetical protein
MKEINAMGSKTERKRNTEEGREGESRVAIKCPAAM